MKAKQKIVLIAFIVVALAVVFWTGYLQGAGFMSYRDLIASIILPIIFLGTLAKLTFAFVSGRDGRRPPGGGSAPPSMPLGVREPRPPATPPRIYCEAAALPER